MSWLVDTCVLLDVLQGDPTFGEASARTLDALAADGLDISPVTWVELAPYFLGDAAREEMFLREVGIRVSWRLDESAVKAAGAVWAAHVAAKRAGTVPKRPIADVLIGALALRHDGLVTRNEKDFRRRFPGLRIVVPG